MENSARIRVNLSTKEYEVEGSEQFVKEYAEKIENQLLNLTSERLSGPKSTSDFEENGSLQVTQKEDIPETFGEYLNSFSKVNTDVDRVLLAGYFIQRQSTENSFITRDASKLLLEQGIKPANTTRCITNNKNTKKVIVLSKGRFRVSQIGIEYIKNLRG